MRRADWEADGVLSFELQDPAGGDLPPWAPGAHIDVVLPSGLVRQYSLCGDPADPRRYKVAVLREAQGRGGSREFHETQLVGALLEVRGPRNHFALVPAPAYRLIAGGIGVTPILTMIEALDRQGGDWKLLYGARSRRSMAFRERLGAWPERVEFTPEDEQGRPDFDRFLAEAPVGAAIYCCGPEGMIQAVEQSCDRVQRGLDLHVERFSPAAVEPEMATDGGDGAFEVELRRTGLVLRVEAGTTLLDAVRNAGVTTVSSCETGICGACETSVIEGAPLHRDGILSAKERLENKTMMICVGRSLSKRLVLDL